MNYSAAKWIFNVAWALLLLLGVSAFLISSGQSSHRTEPKVSSYDVSGASALADLLRLRGYQIAVDPHPHPKISSRDVVLAFKLESPVQGPDADPDQPLDEQKKLSETAQDIEKKTKSGAVIFWLPLPQSFDVQDSDNSATRYVRLDGKARELLGDPMTEVVGDSGAQIALASGSAGTFATAEKIGSGYRIDYGSGIGLTNRYLSQADNAQFFLETLKTYAPNATRVVFPEATFGERQEPGLLETMGPWAEGAWYQVLFLFAVVIWTLNRRFGLPRQLRRTQAGGRELVDALTDIMTRARATSMSLENTLLHADARIRTIFKLRPGATEAERDAMLSPKLKSALTEVRAAAAMKKVRPNDALDLVIALEKQLHDASAQRQAVAPPPRSKRPYLV
jgi:hypothetical protein